MDPCVFPLNAMPFWDHGYSPDRHLRTITKTSFRSRDSGPYSQNINQTETITSLNGSRFTVLIWKSLVVFGNSEVGNFVVTWGLRICYFPSRWSLKRFIFKLVNVVQFYSTKNQGKAGCLFVPKMHFFCKVMLLHVSLILFTWGGVSRPTPMGEVEESGLGGGLQAHTWGGRLRGLAGGSPVPHPGGSPGPHRRGSVSQHALRQTATRDSFSYGRYASYWNVFLFPNVVFYIYEKPISSINPNSNHIYQ